MSNLNIAPSTSAPIKQTTLQMQGFWRQISGEIHEINPETENFKFQILPLSRIKKVMKLEDDIREETCMISGEAPVVFAKACEIFILELSKRAWIISEEGKRRTLLKSDLAKAAASSELYDFLLDVVPREGVSPSLDDRGYPVLAMGSSTISFSNRHFLPLPMDVEIQFPSPQPGEASGSKAVDGSSPVGVESPFLLAKGIGISVTARDPENPNSYTMQLVNTGELDGKVTAIPMTGPLTADLLSTTEKRPLSVEEATEDSDPQKRLRVDTPDAEVSETTKDSVSVKTSTCPDSSSAARAVISV